jgi:hypothetical protein
MIHRWLFLRRRDVNTRLVTSCISLEDTKQPRRLVPAEKHPSWRVGNVFRCQMKRVDQKYPKLVGDLSSYAEHWCAMHEGMAVPTCGCVQRPRRERGGGGEEEEERWMKMD